MTISCLVLVYLSWGSCYISVKFALESFPPFLLCGMRMTLAGGILYLATWLYGERTSPTLADCRQCFILAFFMVLISSGFLCKGQESVPSGVAGMFAGMEPGFFCMRQDRANCNVSALLVVLSAFCCSA